MGKSHRISLRMRWYRAGQRLGFRRHGPFRVFLWHHECCLLCGDADSEQEGARRGRYGKFSAANAVRRSNRVFAAAVQRRTGHVHFRK